MLYATSDDFIVRIGEFQTLQLTDRDNVGVINDDLLTVALSDASSQIDGYLNARYALPLSVIPQNLTRICCDIARYRLCSMSDVAITDEIIKRYELSLKELEGIANGKISLNLPEPETEDGTGSSESAVIFTNGFNRVFGRDHRN